MTHNGWTNYETWATYFWITNDQETLEEVERLLFNCEFSYEQEMALRNYIEENNPLINQANLYVDLLDSALNNVNWIEVSKNILGV